MYIEKAEIQAQKIMDVANQNAKTVIESTQLRMEAAKQEIKKYEKQVADYKRRFRLFLEDQMAYAESKLENEDVLGQQAAEISQSINNQMCIRDRVVTNTLQRQHYRLKCCFCFSSNLFLCIFLRFLYNESIILREHIA